jgi:flavin reductase (DIM6/NTAB) family NADH-FMN oxidoreductase RutF
VLGVSKIVLESRGRCFTVKPLVLVTTLGSKGFPNVAPKTQAMDVGRREQYFAFICASYHHTYQNVKANQEFVVNYPGPELIEMVSAAAQQAEDVDEIALAGLTSIPSVAVKPPRIKECYLHLECKLLMIKDLEDSSLILGKVVARSADEEVTFERGKSRETVRLLSKHPLLAYVYPDHYAKINAARQFVFPKNYKP